MKKQSRHQFTEEERADSILERPIAKSEKAADKVEKVQVVLVYNSRHEKLNAL